MRKHTLFIAFLLLLMACEPCRVSSEPSLGVDFTQQTQIPAFTRVYGLGGNGQSIPFKSQSINKFPVSLLADSTVYIFESPTRIDTLTVGYDRSMVEFQKKRCGFTMRLSNVRLLPSTTFTDARLFSQRSTRYEEFTYRVVVY